MTVAEYIANQLYIKGVREVLENALRISIETYPGPVHIGLPADIADNGINNDPYPEHVADEETYNNDLARIITLLENSRSPLIAAGFTAKRLGLENMLLRLLENYRIPVVLTPMAKGLISEDHECYAGVLFHSLSDYLDDLYEKTDLVIGLGYDPVEFNYESWMPQVPLVHFDLKITDMPPTINSVQYIGKPDEWFSILGNLNKSSLVFHKTVIEGIRNEMSAVFNGFTNHFGPAAALKSLQDELPEDTVVTADEGLQS